MKFRIREATEFLYVHVQDIGGLSVLELQREARRAGLLGFGYHYVIQKDGTVEQGRKPYEVAGHDFENPNVSVYVLVDSLGNLTDAQKAALRDLKSSLQGEYPRIEVR